MKFYHGTWFNIEDFNLEHLEGGEHSFGIGIYFSKQKEIVSFYSEQDGEKRNIYEVDLDLKPNEIIKYNETLNIIQLENLIKNKNILYLLDIPFYKIMWVIYKDFFQHLTLKDYVELFTLKTGIKACLKQEPYKDFIREDICVMDPSVIKIINPF
jgi:hypothetical protein